MSLESWLQREERKTQDAARADGLVAVERDPSGLALSAPGAKADDGKTLAGVLLDFGHALEGVAKVGTMGAAKYSRGGWKQVPSGQQRYMDAALRHLLKHSQGETHDPESGLAHIAHATWNLLAVAELDARGGK